MAKAKKGIARRLLESLFGVNANPYRRREMLGFAGGVANTGTGMGTAADRTTGAFYRPSWYDATYLEICYAESWAIKRAVDCRIDDGFQRRPQFEDGGDEGAADRLNAEILRLDLYTKLMRAMKMGQLHGTGLLVINTRAGSLASPLADEMVMPNDLVDLIPVDRESAHVDTWQTDIAMPDFNRPLFYKCIFSARSMSSYELVHHSRVLRFDGVISLSEHTWIHDRDFGRSIVPLIIKAVLDEEQAAAGITSLTQEASIPVVKSPGFQDALSEGNFAATRTVGEMGMEDIAKHINDLRSIHRILFVDAEGDYSRVSVPFSGLPQTLNELSRRIAAAVGVPVTRFLGQSPVGLQSTGEGEMKNYANEVAAMQENVLRPVLKRLYTIIARSAGLAAAPEFHFPSLVDVSDKDKAETAKQWGEFVAGLVNAGIIDENEARMMLKTAVEQARDLERLTDAELEERRRDPVEEAELERIRMEQERAGGNPQGGAEGNSGA